MNNLHEKYSKEVRPAIQKKLGIMNVMAVPRLLKIVISAGMGEALSDKKTLEKMSEQLMVITGQKPRINKAKQAISTFKLREGDQIGLQVTLRGKRMEDFFTRLCAIALPRVRDFRGVPVKGFDGKGNYTLGIKEQTIFPEIDYNLVDKVRGFAVTFVTSAKNDVAGRELLAALGLPYEKKTQGE